MRKKMRSRCTACRKEIILEDINVKWFTSGNVEGRGCDYRYPKCKECVVENKPITWDEFPELNN